MRPPTILWRFPLAFLLLLATLHAAAAAPAGFDTVALPQGVRAVLDGDTFDADLDGDGQIALPRERVRLLWVDAPELGESHKGQDRAHGLPALDFLAQLLERRPLVLHVPRERPTGNYGRTLALVEAGGENVSLALIRAGHSYFDTRFSVPADYDAYVAAEAEAFSARRGIWGDAPSRRHYLERLKDELKTPAAPDNPLYVPGLHHAADFRPAALLGKYVHLAGTVASLRTAGKGVRILTLRRDDAPPFPVVAFRRYAERLDVDAWVPGTQVRVAGFVQTYHGHLELVLHHGQAVP